MSNQVRCGSCCWFDFAERLEFGRVNVGEDGNYGSGILDELLVFNLVLSPDEMEEIYDQLLD